jgi:uncharacterized membrane protein YcjF (UPF0283 family)
MGKPGILAQCGNGNRPKRPQGRRRVMRDLTMVRKQKKELMTISGDIWGWMILFAVVAWMLVLVINQWQTHAWIKRTNELLEQLSEQVGQNALTPLQHAANRIAEREEEDWRRAHPWRRFIRSLL